MGRKTLMSLDQRRRRRQRGAEMLRRGASVAEVSRAFGWSFSWSRQLCTEYGLIPPSAARDRFDRLRVRAVEKVRRGMAMAKVAEQLQVSDTFVYQACRQKGITCKGPGRILSVFRAIIAEPGDRLNLARVARTTGMSDARVRAIKKEAVALGLINSQGFLRRGWLGAPPAAGDANGKEERYA